MNPGDTSLGGSKKDFPKTVWELVSLARDPSAEARRAGLEELCRQYWKPIYSYIRLSCAKSNEEAKDLAQGFFLHLVESDDLDRYKSERASFRTYLKMVLKHFVQDEDKKAQALKRGGGRQILELDAPAALWRGVPSDSETADPEKAFDQGWRAALLKRAVERVRERFLSDERAMKFRVFEHYDLSPEEKRPTYSALAARLGLKPSDVQNYLVLVRGEVLSELRTQLAGMTADLEELRDEWNTLFAS